MNSGVFISVAEFSLWPNELQTAVLKQIFKGNLQQPIPEHPSNSAKAVAFDTSDEHFAQFSPGQAREFLDGCAKKTREVLLAIIKQGQDSFSLKQICIQTGLQISELPGVWTGLTRRTRTIAKDSKAYLIDWFGEPIVDNDGNYIDQKGRLTSMTYHSLCKALGLE